MKKTYIVPTTEIVKLRLTDQVLGDPGMGAPSKVDGGDMDSKENTGLWDDVDDEEPWSSVTESSNDLWGLDENEEE